MSNIVSQNTSQEHPRKHCNRCNRDLPATKDCFGKDKGGKSGLRSICKECRNKHEVQLRQNRLEERRAYEISFRETHREAIRENNRRYEQKTRGKRAEYFKEYHKNNPDVGRHARKNYYYRHREAENKVSRLYTLNNPEKVRRLRQRWSAAHPEQRKAISHKRRALKRGNGGTYTAQDIRNKLIAQKHTCYYCHNTLKKRGKKYLYHVEHVVPISKGGSNWPDNIVIACPTCNQKKGDKLLHEWLEGGRLL